MPRRMINPFPKINLDDLQYHPALQKLRIRYSPDPGSTSQENGYFLTKDGTRLFTRRWFNKNTEKKGTIACFHGLGGDSEYFVLFADQVVQHGFEVVIHDYQGHGLSEGLRGDIKSFSTFTSHAREFLCNVAENNKNVPLFILGESMGGTVLVNMLIDNNYLPNIAGILLFAPGLKLKTKSVTIKDILFMLGVIISYPFKPSRLIYNVRPVYEKNLKDGKEIMNPLHFEYDATNPLHLDRISSRLLLQLARAFNTGYKHGPSAINTSLLVFMGENDLAIDIEGIKAFIDRVNVLEKELVVVPGAPHAMFTHDAFQSSWDKILGFIKVHA